MKDLKIAAMAVLAAAALSNGNLVSAQDKKEVNLDAVPPKVLVLEHRQSYSGKGEERRKLEESLSAACERLDAPRIWIDLESLSGEPEALIFSPFESYEQMEQSDFSWSQFLGGHADLLRMKQEANGLVGGERKIIAIRRDDLGYLADTIDLSETRFVQVLEVRLFPGRENDFADAFKVLSDAHTKVQAETPWVVYEVDAGLPAPTFLVLSPMAELKERDDLLAQAGGIADAEGDGAETFKKIARESFAATESTIYIVNPGMSHVSKAFAATDLDFWMHRNLGVAPEPKPEARPETKTKPKPSN